MLSKTRGIVLKITPYGESSVICRIYTDVFGVQSYLVRSVRNNKGSIKNGLLQPLNFLEMVVYHKPHVGLQRIKEARVAFPFEQIHLEINRTCIAIFVLEVLNRSLKEEVASAEIFEFLQDAIVDLDQRQNGLAVFPHYFMIQLACLLGFSPERVNWKPGYIFDLAEGHYATVPMDSSHFIDENGTELLHRIESSSFQELDQILAAKSVRKELLTQLIKYFQFHISGNGAFNSHHVLQQIMEQQVSVSNGI
jgi:DNA repair protein RecO (recombination protein O)